MTLYHKIVKDKAFIFNRSKITINHLLVTVSFGYNVINKELYLILIQRNFNISLKYNKTLLEKSYIRELYIVYVKEKI